MLRASRFSHAYLLLVAGIALTPSVKGQESWGKLTGTVTDPSGSVVPGAHVAVSSLNIPRGAHTVSDERGTYAFGMLAPGVYTVTVVAPGFHTLHYHNLDIRLGIHSSFHARLSLGSVAESIEVNDAPAALDLRSSATSTSITPEAIQSLPRGRNLHTILVMAPGARQEVKAGAAGVGGLQVDGASGSENAYYIDGVEVSDLLSGALRIQNSIPLEFVNQIQVKSGGFEAEFGGATGGVVNVATRAGSNDFHGEALFAGTGHPFNAGDRGFYQRSILNADLAEFLRPKEDDYRVLFPGFSAGGAAVRDRLFWFGSYMPEFERTRRRVEYTEGSRVFEQARTRHYALGRLDFSPIPSLQMTASHIWSPMRRSGALPSRDARMAAPVNDVSRLGEYLPSQTFSASAAYSATSRLLIGARYGYKYQNNKVSGYGLSNQPVIVYRTATANAAGVPDSYAGPNGFQSFTGTYGVERDITTRKGVNIDASYVRAVGRQQHMFKAGYALNNFSNDINDGFSNGRFDIFWGDGFTRGAIADARGRFGHYIFQDGPRSLGAVRGRNHGLYIQDSWRVHARVTLNLGFRAESEYLPPYRAEVNGVRVANPISFNWADKMAPRLGGAWDILGDGHWKLSGSYGLFYDAMKYSLARTSFGGQHWISYVYGLDDFEVNRLSRLQPGALGRPIASFDNRSMPIDANGRPSGIDPELKPYSTREFTLALDRLIGPRWQAGVRYTRKTLLRTIEDIGILDASDTEIYMIGNPGFGLTRTPGSVYGSKTPDGMEWMFPRATRRFDAIEFRAEGQHGDWNLLASYTWSRLFGNYAGLANSDEAGRSDPSISRSFDLPFYYFDSTGSQRNHEGRLATDRPHAAKIFSWYDFDLRRFGAMKLGVTQMAMSGALDSTTAGYLSAPIFPFGRGDLGRMPVFTQTDINVAHSFRLSETAFLRLEANVTNALNQAAVISRVTNLNRSGSISAARLPVAEFFRGFDVRQHIGQGAGTPPLNPIYGLPGGDPNDGGLGLRAGRSDWSSAFLALNPGFGAYQGPRSVRLGLRFLF